MSIIDKKLINFANNHGVDVTIEEAWNEVEDLPAWIKDRRHLKLVI